MKLFKKHIYTLITRPREVFYHFFPGKISYSQSGEDMILDFLFRYKRDWFYVDVWANHPSRLSNTFFFYKYRWWKGINIEPNPSLWKQFLSQRKWDNNLNLWISSESWDLIFYEISPDTLSTFSKDAAEDYTLQWHTLAWEYKIPVLSLDQLFSKYLWDHGKIDFLSIDTEGYDMIVLQSNNWEKYRPKAIVLETLEYKKNGGGVKIVWEFDVFLKGKDYFKYADTYLNTIFISKEFAHEISFQ